ncbi:MAG: type II toxin-antitoxin system Phd/YefM family antitoxin [Eubacteriales bacterium]|nr:type II toxin-antitoxin system Phd/YefM family antitoxin [Eubacteriales bacterium]
MNSVISAIENTVSISLFNRGLAGKIFSDVRHTGAKVVMKNNMPECVLLSPEEYVKLINAVNDAELIALAAERLEKIDSSTFISADEINKEYGITEKELEGFDEVEIE